MKKELKTREIAVEHIIENKDFISFCLDNFDKGQSVQTIWHSFLDLIGARAPEVPHLLE